MPVTQGHIAFSRRQLCQKIFMRDFLEQELRDVVGSVFHVPETKRMMGFVRQCFSNIP